MVLHGWKQIAQYLGCGIRTAQRWEGQCGLPITRPRNHLRSPVLAQSEGLDAWASGGRATPAVPWDGRFEELQQQLQELKREVAALAARAPGSNTRAAAAQRDAAAAVATRPRELVAKAPGFEA